LYDEELYDEEEVGGVSCLPCTGTRSSSIGAALARLTQYRTVARGVARKGGAAWRTDTSREACWTKLEGKATINALERALLAARRLKAAMDGRVVVYSPSRSDEQAALGVKQSWRPALRARLFSSTTWGFRTK
jgi:hypothetical protein